MRNLVLTSVNGQRPISNMQQLMDILVKRENGQSLEFRLSHVHLDRAKVGEYSSSKLKASAYTLSQTCLHFSGPTVICMDAKEVVDSELRIMSNYSIDAFCSNALSPALKREAEGKAHRHGVTCGLKTMRALRNAVRETTLVVRRPASAVTTTAATTGAPGADGVPSEAVAATRRIMDFSETHKMQSAPLFAGKYTEEGGW